MMAATKKSAAKSTAATKKPEPAAAPADDQDVVEEPTPPPAPPNTPAAPTAPDSEVPTSAPAGYVWVTRKRPVQIGTANPQWEEPSLIDAKSFAELEAQGYKIVAGPDADRPSA